MRSKVHLVQHARLEIRDVWSLSALCGKPVRVSLRCDSPLPKNATEDHSKVTCRRCALLMASPSPHDLAELHSKISNVPDFGATWEEREAIAETTAKIEFGCDFQGNMRSAIKENYRGGCCQSCSSRRGYLEKIKPSASKEILSLFDRVWGFYRPGVGCTLPRKWQSATCLFFSCHPFVTEKNKRDLVQISKNAGNPKSIRDALVLAEMDAQSRAS